MNDQWLGNLRNRISSHKESAPEGLWEDLERLIVSDNITSENDINVQGTKRYQHWLTSVGTAVAAAVILLFFILNNQHDNQINKNLIYDNQATSELADKSVDDFNETVKSYVEATEEIQIAENNIKIEESAKGNSGNTESQASLLDYEKGFLDKLDAIEVDENDSSPVKNNIPKQEVSEENLSDNMNFDKKDDPLFASSNIINNSKRSRWQASVSMSNTTLGSTKTFPGYGTLALKETVDQEYAFLSQYTREGVYTDIEHEQPITFGLTFRYNLSEKWNITSGITYSLLSSKLRSQGDNYFYDDNQTLHYIGVPLNIAYNIWQNKKLLSYISVGTHVQKNIAGRLSSNYYIDNQLELKTLENISTKHPQWSVNSAVGIEYKVTDFLGLYAEPGIDYYFKNSSELETIYKDRPFSFNLSLGLRLTFND